MNTPLSVMVPSPPPVPRARSSPLRIEQATPDALDSPPSPRRVRYVIPLIPALPDGCGVPGPCEGVRVYLVCEVPMGVVWPAGSPDPGSPGRHTTARANLASNPEAIGAVGEWLEDAGDAMKEVYYG